MRHYKESYLELTYFYCVKLSDKPLVPESLSLTDKSVFPVQELYVINDGYLTE